MYASKINVFSSALYNNKHYYISLFMFIVIIANILHDIILHFETIKANNLEYFLHQSVSGAIEIHLYIKNFPYLGN